MRRLVPLLLLAAVACAGPSPRPDRPAPPSPAAATPVPGASPAHPWDRLAPCGGLQRPVSELEASLEGALLRGDARCASQAEIGLGIRLWMGGDPREGDLRLRQAGLRAADHGADDLAALAHLGRTRIRLKAGDAEAALFHLDRAVEAADLFAATTGEAAPDLDGLHRLRVVEALAHWERSRDPQWFEVALASAERLGGREALRAFAELGVSPTRLLEAADLPAGAARLTRLQALTRTVAGPESPARREAAASRAAEVETFLADAPFWTVSEPLLLDWIPGRVPALLTTVQAVLGEGERLILLVPGARHGARLVLGPRTITAAPLPGEAWIAEALAACEDAAACPRLAQAVLGSLDGATRVLIAPQGALHALPLEALAPEGVQVQRVPSALGTAGLRLRALAQGPEAHPEARGLLPPELQAPLPGPPGAVTSPAPAPPVPAGVAALRATLASGHPVVIMGRRGSEGGEAYGMSLDAPRSNAGTEPH